MQIFSRIVRFVEKKVVDIHTYRQTFFRKWLKWVYWVWKKCFAISKIFDFGGNLIVFTGLCPKKVVRCSFVHFMLNVAMNSNLATVAMVNAKQTYLSHRDKKFSFESKPKRFHPANSSIWFENYLCTNFLQNHCNHFREKVAELHTYGRTFYRKWHKWVYLALKSFHFQQAPSKNHTQLS